MKKRFAVILLVMLMLIGSANAYVAPRASLYLDSYLIQIIPQGGGAMTVSYGVYGTGKMTKIGVNKIVIEEQLGNGRWITVETHLGTDDSNSFYSYNAYSHGGSVDFVGLPGVKYRATLTAYAGNSSGSDTGTLTCTAQTCK